MVIISDVGPSWLHVLIPNVMMLQMSTPRKSCFELCTSNMFVFCVYVKWMIRKHV